MQLSYNIIKNTCTNTIYTIKAPVMPKKVEKGMGEGTSKDTSIEDAKAYGEELINDAVNKSKGIIDSANKEAERIKKEAYDASSKKGYAEGFEKGRGEGLKSTEGVRLDAKALLEEAHRVSLEYIDGQKGEILNLALHIAEKIIRYQADVSDSVVVKIAQDAIMAAVVKGQVIIRANPMDYALLDSSMGELSKAAGEGTVIKIVRDNEIKRGGCRVETEDSFVDASIDTQFEKIKQALIGS